MSKKIRFGVFGLGRGAYLVDNVFHSGAEVVALCDKRPAAIANCKKDHPMTKDCVEYADFDEFIKHDMDAVLLCNYFNEHTEFAIKAMKAGKHVLSEVLPVQTMKEAVELVEAIEETGMTYAYAENYCYMPAPYEMKVLYQQGKIGEFEYGECEYVHNCEPIWPSITYGERDHWRNNMFSTFYCTHSIGPIIHSTGLRPISVIGIEGTKTERNLRDGAKSGQFGIEMITLENGGIIKSIHGGLYEDSVWYSMYGSKGRMESAREGTDAGDIAKIYVKADVNDGDYAKLPVEAYNPKRAHDESAKGFGHGNSDFYTMWHFVEKLKGNPEADVIDVFEALDMGLPGLFAYRSILNGNIPMQIPNLRNKEERDRWRNDTACTDPKVAGDMLLPTFSKGTPDIPDEVYERVKNTWEEQLRKQKEENK